MKTKLYALKVCDVEHAHSSLHPVSTTPGLHRLPLHAMRVVIQSYCYACSNTGQYKTHDPNKRLHFTEWKYKMVADRGVVIYHRNCFQTWKQACDSAKQAWPRAVAMLGDEYLYSHYDTP